MFIALYCSACVLKRPSSTTSMDLFMVCAGIVILMGLLALLGLGVLAFIQGAVVEHAPYPLMITAYVCAACLMCTLAMGLSLWAHYEEGAFRARAPVATDATHSGLVVMGRPAGVDFN